MKKILFFLSICIGFAAQAQQLKTNFYATGAKESEGILLCSDPRVLDKNFDTFSKEEQERILASTIKEGEWKYWFESGKLRTIETYKNGIKTGFSKTYYENGNLESELYYNGATSTTYYENGTKQSEGKFSDVDIPDGEWKGWHENGNLNYISNYVNGVNQGYTKWFDASGKLYFEQQFTDGKIIKETKF